MPSKKTSAASGDPPREKSRRGGRRAGAGRKPNGYSSRSKLDAIAQRYAEAAPAEPDDIQASARARGLSIVTRWKKIMLAGRSESARVDAAVQVLDRGYGKPSVETGVDQLPLFGGGKQFFATESGLVVEACRKLGPLAIEVLSVIAEFSESESASVKAGKALVDRGFGTVGIARLEAMNNNKGALGKKEQAALDAVQAGAGTDWGDDLQPRTIRPN